MRKIAAFCMSVFTVGCGAAVPQESNPAAQGPSFVSNQGLQLATSENAFCPAGSTFLASHRLCVTKTDAIGPFTPEMVAACKQWGGGEAACEQDRWEIAFAKGIRGTNRCAPGTEYNSYYDECLRGNEAYGPFSRKTVEFCKKWGGGSNCETMRIAKDLLPVSEVSEKKLNVPYFWQEANAYEPGRTCNLTSLTMVLDYYGKKLTPDQVYLKAGGPVFTGSGIAEIARSYGLNAKYTERGSKEMIKQYLNEGKPVILQGWFSASGHFVVITGYDSTGWIVNDPEGEWSGGYKSGYMAVDPHSGNGIHYSFKGVERVAADEGDPNSYWITVVSK